MGFYNTEDWPEKSEYYRLPFSNNDNPISWLETTDICNIYCKGCYRKNLGGHQPLDVLKEEVDFLQRVRNTDGISIAGGEPLIYPHIVPLVEYIAKKGLKPVVISNTYALDEPMLKDLYNAGLSGITCHIDMIQERPDRPAGAASEKELNLLRQEKADLLHNVTKGNINVTFNSTIYHENFHQIPDIVRWARANVEKVHGLVFICYRGIPISKAGFDAGDGVDLQEELGYVESDSSQIDIMSVDIYNLLRDAFGKEYDPCSYLGGTGHINEYKWWIQAAAMEKNGKVHGSIGPRTMEFLQSMNHFFNGTYFLYNSRNRAARLPLLLTALLGDRRGARMRRSVAKGMFNPLNWFRHAYTQSIGIVQAPDMMDNGMPNMCESCPDMCVWEGNLVNSCRLDEYRKYGRMLNAIMNNSVEGADKRMNDPEAVVTGINSDQGET